MDLNLPEERVFEADASVLRRLCALILDIILISVVFSGPFSDLLVTNVSPDMKLSEIMEHASQTTVTDGMIGAVMGIVLLAVLYFALCQHMVGQTLGMAALGIYTIMDPEITRNSQRSFPGFWRSLLRSLYVIPVFPFWILWIVEPIYLLMHNRTFLEKVSRTKTIEFRRMMQDF